MWRLYDLFKDSQNGGDVMSDAVQLPSKMDLTAASGLATTLRENQSSEITVDFSDVKMLGALCLQVLLSAAISLNNEGRKLHITNVPDRVLDQLRVMGLTPDDISRGRQ